MIWVEQRLLLQKRQKRKVSFGESVSELFTNLLVSFVSVGFFLLDFSDKRKSD